MLIDGVKKINAKKSLIKSRCNSPRKSRSKVLKKSLRKSRKSRKYRRSKSRKSRRRRNLSSKSRRTKSRRTKSRRTKSRRTKSRRTKTRRTKTRRTKSRRTKSRTKTRRTKSRTKSRRNKSKSRTKRKKLTEEEKIIRKEKIINRALENCRNYGLTSIECNRTMKIISKEAKDNIKKIIYKLKLSDTKPDCWPLSKNWPLPEGVYIISIIETLPPIFVLSNGEKIKGVCYDVITLPVIPSIIQDQVIVEPTPSIETQIITDVAKDIIKDVIITPSKSDNKATDILVNNIDTVAKTISDKTNIPVDNIKNIIINEPEIIVDNLPTKTISDMNNNPYKVDDVLKDIEIPIIKDAVKAATIESVENVIKNDDIIKGAIADSIINAKAEPESSVITNLALNSDKLVETVAKEISKDPKVVSIITDKGLSSLDKADAIQIALRDNIPDLSKVLKDCSREELLNAFSKIPNYTIDNILIDNNLDLTKINQGILNYDDKKYITNITRDNILKPLRNICNIQFPAYYRYIKDKYEYIDDMNIMIIKYINKNFNINIGERVAETIRTRYMIYSVNVIEPIINQNIDAIKKLIGIPEVILDSEASTFVKIAADIVSKNSDNIAPIIAAETNIPLEKVKENLLPKNVVDIVKELPLSAIVSINKATTEEEIEKIMDNVIKVKAVSTEIIEAIYNCDCLTLTKNILEDYPAKVLSVELIDKYYQKAIESYPKCNGFNRASYINCLLDKNDVVIFDTMGDNFSFIIDIINSQKPKQNNYYPINITSVNVESVNIYHDTMKLLSDESLIEQEDLDEIKNKLSENKFPSELKTDLDKLVYLTIDLEFKNFTNNFKNAIYTYHSLFNIPSIEDKLKMYEKDSQISKLYLSDKQKLMAIYIKEMIEYGIIEIKADQFIIENPGIMGKYINDKKYLFLTNPENTGFRNDRNVFGKSYVYINEIKKNLSTYKIKKFYKSMKEKKKNKQDEKYKEVQEVLTDLALSYVQTDIETGDIKKSWSSWAFGKDDIPEQVKEKLKNHRDEIIDIWFEKYPEFNNIKDPVERINKIYENNYKKFVNPGLITNNELNQADVLVKSIANPLEEKGFLGTYYYKGAYPIEVYRYIFENNKSSMSPRLIRLYQDKFDIENLNKAVKAYVGLKLSDPSELNKYIDYYKNLRINGNYISNEEANNQFRDNVLKKAIGNIYTKKLFDKLESEEEDEQLDDLLEFSDADDSDDSATVITTPESEEEDIDIDEILGESDSDEEDLNERNAPGIVKVGPVTGEEIF